MQRAHFTLYVNHQEASTRFYIQILAVEPILNVPGRTEFSLPENSVLGLMPEDVSRRLLGVALPDSSPAWGGPRSELYLVAPLPEHQVGQRLSRGRLLVALLGAQ